MIAAAAMTNADRIAALTRPRPVVAAPDKPVTL